MTTVLVVDDEPNIRFLIQTILECEGYQVLTAGDGQEALTLAHWKHPDLVTLDVMMPGMDGWELGRLLASAPGTCGIRRMIVSAKPLAELEADPDRGAVHAVLRKPFDFVAFVEAVHDVLAEAA